jgi:CRP/FNR family cyclic AMP-dependent transcriptional regulator
MALFDGFTVRDIQRITSAGTFLRLPADWSPIQQLTGADKAYLLLSGAASVRRGGQEIATLGPGDIFGESAILHHKLRNASIVTTTPVEVLHFTSDAVRRLCREVPAFQDALDREASTRLGTP